MSQSNTSEICSGNLSPTINKNKIQNTLPLLSKAAVKISAPPGFTSKNDLKEKFKESDNVILNKNSNEFGQEDKNENTTNNFRSEQVEEIKEK
jgi:anti-sigma28 factor (negative regulator of flagellin synthesis)